MSAYAYEFLCKEIKINGEKVEGQITPSGEYVIVKSFSLDGTKPTEVKLELIANEGQAKNDLWKFELRYAGEKPSLSQEDISFSIKDDLPVTEEFLKELVDPAKKPIYEFHEAKPTVKISTEKMLIKDVHFKLGGTVVNKKKLEHNYYGYSTEYEFDINDDQAHDVELIIRPLNTSKYSNLVYTFQLKKAVSTSPVDVDVMPQFFINDADFVVEKAETDVDCGESVNFRIRFEEFADELQEVEITEDSNAPHKITSNFDSDFARMYELLDSTPEKNAITKKIVVKITPKTASGYKVTTYTFNLKGTRIAKDNAKFANLGVDKFAPNVSADMTWVYGINYYSSYNEISNNYGARTITLKAVTESPRAKVKYQIVDMEGKAIEEYDAKELVATASLHTSEEITLFEDKPTKIKAWVVAEDGKTEDSKYGVWEHVFNPVYLTWGYRNKDDAKYYKMRAYDTIEVDRNKVRNNRIYLVFEILMKDSNNNEYSVENAYNGFQGRFENISGYHDNKLYNKTEINLEQLITGREELLEAVLPVEKQGDTCLRYKVKIMLKN